MCPVRTFLTQVSLNSWSGRKCHVTIHALLNLTLSQSDIIKFFAALKTFGFIIQGTDSILMKIHTCWEIVGGKSGKFCILTKLFRDSELPNPWLFSFNTLKMVKLVKLLSCNFGRELYIRCFLFQHCQKMTGWNFKERREFLKPEYCLNTDLGGKKNWLQKPSWFFREVIIYANILLA